MKRDKHQHPNFLTCPAFSETDPQSVDEAVRRLRDEPPDHVPFVVEDEPLPESMREFERHAPKYETTDNSVGAQGGRAVPTPPRNPPAKKTEALGDRLKKSRTRRLIKWGVALAVISLLIATVPAGIALVRAGLAANQVRAALTRAQSKVQANDIAGAEAEVGYAREQLDQFHNRLYEVGFWRDLPGVGVQIRGLEDAARAGQSTLDGMSDLLSVYRVVIEALQGAQAAAGEIGTGIAPTRSFNDLSPEEKHDLLAKFSDSLPKLRLAREKIAMAMEMWNRVPQDQMFAPIRTALKPLADNLPLLNKAIDESVPLIEALVPLAGYPNPQRYLLLLLNNDELRPGGGFIGNVGTMTLNAGDITDLQFQDVYKIDMPAEQKGWNVKPPQPILDRLGVKYWFLRDANWSPDFSVSAENILDFYIREKTLASGKLLSDAPQTVLAFEPEFFRKLLQLTGPVTIEDKIFSANDFFDKLQYEVEQGFFKEGIPTGQRKDIVHQLGNELIAKLKALPAKRWPELLDIATQALERKQIMAYSRDANVMAILDRNGWSARAKPTRGDFLWVVDANLAAFKTDGVMDKNVKYELDATDPQNPIATVTLTYKHTYPKFDWRYTRYRSYTRVYVPEGSVLISSAGAMKDDRYKTRDRAIAGQVDVMKELGKTVFGAFWSIEPGQTGTLMFKYRLPPESLKDVAAGNYRLDWPKQAGADATQLTLDLKFGKNLKSAKPAELQVKWGDARYEYTVSSLVDRTFEIRF